MFASIDSPGMRVIEARAETPDGRVLDLDALASLDPSTAERLRSIPADADLQQVADAFVGKEVVRFSLKSERALKRLKTENPGLDLQLDPNLPLVDGALYRIRRAEDPQALEGGNGDIIAKIQLRWWRLAFDREGNKVRAKPLGNGVSAP
jgi:hypothetical protein